MSKIEKPPTHVSVKPKAKSSMSSSSSSGSSSISYWSSSSIITWHVEHAKEPSQAPISIRREKFLKKS